MAAPDLPLSDLRVLDCATFIAAPYCATVMAEFGAEVIKVEKPGDGDPMRRFGTPTPRGDTLAWLSESRNKKSITLDLQKPKGAELFRRLAAKSDVVCENFRPGTLEKWGLGYDALAEVNPGLVMLRVTGYGQNGPYRDRPGFARIAHAVGGIAHLAGIPGDVPVTPGSTSLADYISGLYGVVGVLIALRSRAATGRGQSIDIGLYEAAFRVLDEIAPAYAYTGKVRGRLGRGSSNVCPHSNYRTADDQWVSIACTSDKMFARLAEVMGRPELAAPETYGEVGKRVAARETVEAIVEEWTATLRRDEVMAQCIAGEVPCGPLNTIADIFEDPQFAARANLTSVEVSGLGPIVVPSVMPRLSATPGRIESLGPELGNANRDVYTGLLGLSDDDLGELERDGVI